MVRAIASHQCGPGSIPGLGVRCGLSLLLVPVPAPRVFPRVLRFSSLHKTNISKFQFELEIVERRATPWIPLKPPFIYSSLFTMLQNSLSVSVSLSHSCLTHGRKAIRNPRITLSSHGSFKKFLYNANLIKSNTAPLKLSNP